MSIPFPKLCYEGAQLFLYYSSLTSKHDLAYVIMFCKAVHQFHLLFGKATHTHTNELLYTQCLGKHSSWGPVVCIACTVSTFSSHRARLLLQTQQPGFFTFFSFCEVFTFTTPSAFHNWWIRDTWLYLQPPFCKIFIKTSIKVIGLVAGAVFSVCIFRIILKNILKHSFSRIFYCLSFLKISIQYQVSCIFGFHTIVQQVFFLGGWWRGLILLQSVHCRWQFKVLQSLQIFCEVRAEEQLDITV